MEHGAGGFCGAGRGARVLPRRVRRTADRADRIRGGGLHYGRDGGSFGAETQQCRGVQGDPEKDLSAHHGGGGTCAGCARDEHRIDAQKAEDPERLIWGFLMGKIGNAYGTAGLMGNLYAESGLKANNLQNSFNKKLNIMDEEYTMLVDGGHYPDFVTDKAGYGLAQWTFWSRKQALLDYAREHRKSIGDLQMQLDFLWKVLNESYPAVLTVLKSADTVRQASDAVLLWYERPADQSDAVMVKRAGYGEGYLKKYGSSAEKPVSGGMMNADCPFLVRITAKDLRIRKGAGTDKAWTGRYVLPGMYTIVDVKPGKGSEAGWGRLKSGAGWIALSYAKRV